WILSDGTSTETHRGPVPDLIFVLATAGLLWWLIRSALAFGSQALREEKPEGKALTALDNSIVENLPGLAYVYDPERGFLRWNRNVEKLTGRLPEEIRTIRPLEFFAVEDHERIA